MNPALTFTVYKYQTACGIVDIMMHTMERYFVDEDSINFTDEIAFGLLKAVIKAGKKVMENPNDFEARDVYKRQAHSRRYSPLRWKAS